MLKALVNGHVVANVDIYDTRALAQGNSMSMFTLWVLPVLKFMFMNLWLLSVMFLVTQIILVLVLMRIRMLMLMCHNAP